MRTRSYATAFHHADGKVAEVFSSYNGKTVLRHFQWMQEYGIDGVFVQRFAGRDVQPAGIAAIQHGAGSLPGRGQPYGRTYAVMYDLSGHEGGQMGKVMEDWKLLTDRMQIAKDPKDAAICITTVSRSWQCGASASATGGRYTLERVRASWWTFLKKQGRTAAVR